MKPYCVIQLFSFKVSAHIVYVFFEIYEVDKNKYNKLYLKII